MLQGKEGSPCAGGDADLGVDVLCVVADGLLRDNEQSSDVLFGMPAGEETKHLDLALG